MLRNNKKSIYKHLIIKNKRYYFYKITWSDITGDSGHADLHTALEMYFLKVVLLKWKELKYDKYT